MSDSPNSTNNDSQPSDQSLLALFQNGDQQAAEQLVDRYSPRLLRAARAKISSMFASRFDPEDIVQSTFKSFFRRARGGGYTVPQAGDLFNLLIVIAARKVRSRAVFHQATRRDVRRTDAEADPAQVMDDLRSLHELIQTMEEVCSELGESHRSIVMLRLEGFTIDEIAERSHRSKRTVERALHEFRALLGQYFTP